jgi:hypothetical protein
MNLKERGRFVAVTIAPSSNPLESLIAEAKIRPMPMGSGHIIHQYIKDVEDGIYINVHGDTPIGDLDFKCYHLKQEVHEEAARKAGLKGKFEWGVTEVPEEYLKEGVLGGAILAELETYRISLIWECWLLSSRDLYDLSGVGLPLFRSRSNNGNLAI